MATCSRCGSDCNETSWSSYDYCSDCLSFFQDVRESGVVLRSRHGDEDFDELPFTVSVNVKYARAPHSHSIHDPRVPKSEIDALFQAKQTMEKYDLQGLYVKRDDKSLWLVDEYLEEHPDLRRAVMQKQPSTLQRLKAAIF